MTGCQPLMVVRERERAATASWMAPEPARTPILLSPGTRLIREWNGTTIAVEVREGGLFWEGRTYHSLSEIAWAVTGGHWSGPRFFGLSRRD